jgi:hypothetical protein
MEAQPASAGMLDEPSLRRAEWAAGVPVVLAGQEWHLRRPSWRYSLKRAEDGRRYAATDLVLRGPVAGADEQFRARLAGLQAGPGEDWWTSALSMGALLLEANYEFPDPDDVARLLVFDDDDPASRAMLRAILAAARGEQPADPAAGADAPAAGNEESEAVEAGAG